MSFIRKIEKAIKYIEDVPMTFNGWIVSIGAVFFTRFYVEIFILSQPHKSYDYNIIYFFNFAVVFLFFFGIIYFFLKLLTKEGNEEIFKIILFSSWLIVLPPVLDAMIFGRDGFWGYYIFDDLKGILIRFFTFYGDDLRSGVTLGVRIVTFITILFSSFYIFLKTKKFGKAIIGFLGIYTASFILNCLPSFYTFIIKAFSGKNILEVNQFDVAGMFLTPVEYFKINLPIDVYLAYRGLLIYLILIFIVIFIGLLLFYSKKKVIILIKNIRYPQMIFNWGLLLIGMGVGWFYFPLDNFDSFSVLIIVNYLILVFCAWFFSVFVNDLSDIKIDKVTNRKRPLITGVFDLSEYRNLSKVFLILALVEALSLGGIHLFILILLYILLTWIYSVYPFRLKKYYPISVVLSSFSSLIFFIAGFLLFSSPENIIDLPWRIFYFLFLAFSLILPIKDFKDIEGDRNDGVYTLPVIFGVREARTFLGIALFFLYLFSIVVLKESNLFLWALIFGSASFWVMLSSKVDNQRMNWIIIGLVFLFGLVLVKTIFA